MSKGRERIPVFAKRIERAMEAGRGAPAGARERRLILDLAELNIRASLLSEALQAIAAAPGSRAGRGSYHLKMIRLAHQITGIHELAGWLRRPFHSLVRAQCRKDGESFTLLALAGSTIKGFAPPK